MRNLSLEKSPTINKRTPMFIPESRVNNTVTFTVRQIGARNVTKLPLYSLLMKMIKVADKFRVCKNAKKMFIEIKGAVK